MAMVKVRDIHGSGRDDVIQHVLRGIVPVVISLLCNAGRGHSLAIITSRRHVQRLSCSIWILVTYNKFQ